MERARTTLDKLERNSPLAMFREMGASYPRAPETEEHWNRLPRLVVDPGRMAQCRIGSIDGADASSSFDILRTKILRTLRRNNWTSVAITSPTAACGKTFVSLNLAFSFAKQKDCRTVLVDLDLRHPQVGRILEADKRYSMERFLTQERSLEQTFLRYQDNLAIGPTGRPLSGTAELLQCPTTAPALLDLKKKLQPDVILFDLPPMLVTDDVLAILPNVDCVLLVAAAETSTFNEIDICERSLSEEVNFLGVVLNKCEFSPAKYGY